ncbi:thioredoxin family protein [Aliarcobacter butzleri]|uniref:Thioredoxin family protein n=1 Tax=Aliarcobacter butzleri TaxID=28197 RepID=A0AAW7Q6N8_9BACT|nr:thioredoxin family protein [Aliarcobacter butzleri]MDN5114800.1 thioredoxin family protein [Aliarcobacter butzleri]
MKIIFLSLLFILNLFADFKEGETLFKSKCSSCHIHYISMNVLKENFFEKDNKLLNLKAPTVNMIVYAIMDSPKKIGDSNDIEMQEMEIENYLKSYLENPDRFNSICDEHILPFYDNKMSMKGELKDEDYKNLTNYFMLYKDNLTISNKEIEKSFSSTNEKEIIEKAKKENKKIIVYASSKSCFFCKRMDRDVLNLDEVKKEINKNYIFIKNDMEESALPFNLDKEYKKVTPTFFILSKDGTYIKQYPGAWIKSDFLEILKENNK